MRGEGVLTRSRLARLCGLVAVAVAAGLAGLGARERLRTLEGLFPRFEAAFGSDYRSTIGLLAEVATAARLAGEDHTGRSRELTLGQLEARRRARLLAAASPG